MPVIRMRDFIYLDIERLKSFVSQSEDGLLTTVGKIKKKGKEATTGAEGAIPAFLKAVGGTKKILEDQLSEIKTPHDDIYYKVESALLENDLLIKIPDDMTEQGATNVFEFRDMLYESSFVLAKGRIAISDFTLLRQILEKFNDFQLLPIELDITNKNPGKPKGFIKQEIDKIIESKTNKGELLNETMSKLLKLYFDTFYTGMITVRMFPSEQHPDFRLVGNLQKQFLREDISSITYKYGNAPASEWTIFAQVAAIPPKDFPPSPTLTYGNPGQIALEGMFNAMREMQSQIHSISYPEISITPIAIYRE